MADMVRNPGVTTSTEEAAEGEETFNSDGLGNESATSSSSVSTEPGGLEGETSNQSENPLYPIPGPSATPPERSSGKEQEAGNESDDVQILEIPVEPTIFSEGEPAVEPPAGDSLTHLVDVTLPEEIQKERYQKLYSLQKSKLFTDLILVVGDKEIHVHKSVLSTGSPLFAGALSGPEKITLTKMTLENTGRLLMNNMSYDMALKFVRFIYGQTVEFSLVDDFESNLDFIELLYDFRVVKIVQAIETTLAAWLTVRNAVKAFRLANKISADILKKESVLFIDSHRTVIEPKPDYRSLDDFTKARLLEEMMKVSPTPPNYSAKRDNLTPKSMKWVCPAEFLKRLPNYARYDMRLLVDGNTIVANRVILASYSDWLKEDILVATRANKSARTIGLHIKDFSYDVMCKLVELMYRGRAKDVPETYLTDLIRAADKYQIPLLKVACQSSRISQLCLDNAIEYFIYSVKAKAMDLRDEAIKLIIANKKKLMKTQEYQRLDDKMKAILWEAEIEMEEWKEDLRKKYQINKRKAISDDSDSNDTLLKKALKQ